MQEGEGEQADGEVKEFLDAMGPQGQKRAWTNDGGLNREKSHVKKKKEKAGGRQKVTAKVETVEGKMYVWCPWAGCPGQCRRPFLLTPFFADAPFARAHVSTC